MTGDETRALGNIPSVTADDLVLIIRTGLRGGAAPWDIASEIVKICSGRIIGSHEELKARVAALEGSIQTNVIDGLSNYAFIECDRCGHEVPTQDMDVISIMRDLLKRPTDELSNARRSKLLNNLKKSLKDLYELDSVQFHQVEFDIVARGKEWTVKVIVEPRGGVSHE